ncbi:MAG: hypothetical protein DMD88_09520 [Candidatus Rokuibacteriota bacterium]|nr:MAG: hypothetical protein DMD88_09520 [Candidatus Rokubacteria bacterium]
MTTLVSRRTLLKGGLAVGAGLAVGFPVVRAARGVARAESPGVFAPNQWLRIDRDGVVTIVNSVPEMGQGSLTTTPMIIADELDVVLDQVRVEQAPANPGLYRPASGRCRSRAWRPSRAQWSTGRPDAGSSTASSWTGPRRCPSLRTRSSKPRTSSAISASTSTGATRPRRSPVAGSTGSTCGCRGCSSPRSSAAPSWAAR